MSYQFVVITSCLSSGHWDLFAHASWLKHIEANTALRQSSYICDYFTGEASDFWWCKVDGSDDNLYVAPASWHSLTTTRWRKVHAVKVGRVYVCTDTSPHVGIVIYGEQAQLEVALLVIKELFGSGDLIDVVNAACEITVL